MIIRAHSRSDEETYGNERERRTESPIGGIGAPSLASLSMSGLPIVLTQEDQRQVNDSAAIGGRSSNPVELPGPPSPAVSAAEQLHGHGDEGGTLGRVMLACQYLCGGNMSAARRRH